MRPPPSERAITARIIRWINGHQGCLARKRWGGGMAAAGDPDIDACVRGRSVQIEVKRPGGRVTPLQQQRLGEWQQADAVVGIATSLDDVIELFRRLGVED